MKEQQVKNKIALYCFIALFFICSITTANPSNKWRLEFSGNACSDGEIVIELMLLAGQKFLISTKIENGTSENNVAKTVARTLKDQLPKEAFHVERDDGEDVLIKKQPGASDFDVKIISNTVKHVRINPERE